MMTRQLLVIAGVSAAVSAITVAIIISLLGPVAISPQPPEGAGATPSSTHPVDTVVEMIERVNPAVVSIIVTKDVPVYEQYLESVEGFGWFGNGFSIPRVRERGTEEREVGGGSGFIVSADGLVVTNRHVVADESARYSVLLNDGTTQAVEILARDPQLDIAVLKILTDPVTEFPYVRFGDSEALRLGETVIAIGNALGEFRNSVSLGVVSGLARSVTATNDAGELEALEQVIQTDAAINPGNSGGPLLNVAGEVVGVNVATSRGADNIGFALPARVVATIVASVVEYGEIIRPFLGVRYQSITPALQAELNLDRAAGALLVESSAGESAVWPGSPAEAAGLRAGDIIIALDTEELRGRDLAAILREKRVGDTLQIRYVRGGQEQTTSVKLIEAPAVY